MVEVQNKPKVILNGEPQTTGNKSVAVQIMEILEVVGSILLLISYILYSIFEQIYRLFVPITPKKVSGEIVLITGTGHGMGKELALLYASEGATVVGWDINAKGNEETIKEIQRLGYPKAYPYVCDVSNRDNVLEVAKKVQSEVGDVTVLINNAGIMPTRPLLEQTQDEMERTFKINVLAHFWMLHAFLPAMKRNNYGHIVALSSIAGLLGLRNLVPYCGSKFAVRGIMEALRFELDAEKSNIQLTTICPYMVDTGLCKNPIIKFKNLMPLVKPKDAAKAIMNAQRTDEVQVTIPGYIDYLVRVGRILPRKSNESIYNFINSGVDSDVL